MNKFSHIELDERKLAEQTLQYILSNQHTCLGSTLYLQILDPRIAYGDLKNHIEFLKERLSHLEFIIDYDTVEFKNRIDTFQVLETDDLGRIFDNSGILGPIIFAKENFSEEIFWANEKEELCYQSISAFNCFEEKILTLEKFKKTVINAPFNVDDWAIYYQRLLTLKFTEFSQEIMIGQNIIKYRYLKGDFYMGVETDYRLFKRNLKKDFNVSPNHKLIIFKKIGKNKIERVVIFDKFVHPHFDPPAYSFGMYFYAKNTVHISDRELGVKYIVEREIVDDDMVKLSMSEEFGEHLKRHAYFYYEMLYHTTKEFIKFVEESFESDE